jgi:hypothetical protein
MKLKAADLNYRDYPPEKISCYRKSGRWYLVIADLPHMTANDVAHVFGVNITRTRELLRSYKDDDGKHLKKWVGDKIFLASNGYHKFCIVHDLADGRKVCYQDIMEEVGLSKSAASLRLKSFAAEQIDEKELFQVKTPMGGYGMPEKIKGMQPRRNIDEITPIGICEKNGTLGAGRPTRCTSNSTKGHIYFGD